MRRNRFFKALVVAIGAMFVPWRKMASVPSSSPEMTDVKYYRNLVNFYDDLLVKSEKRLAECAAHCGYGMMHIGKEAVKTLEDGVWIQDGELVTCPSRVPVLVKKALEKGA